MKILIKIIFWFFLTVLIYSSISFAQDYIFFYGNWCPHCAKVDKFLTDKKVDTYFNIDKKEIYFNRNNLSDFNDYIKKLNLSQDQVGVPILIIDSESDNCSYLAWDGAIIDFFDKKLQSLQISDCTWSTCDHLTCGAQSCTHENCQKQWSILKKTSETWNIANTVFSWEKNEDKNIWFSQRIKFLWIMMPAAIADSINPCAFAVMLLLLTAILSKHKNKKKALLAWFLFAFAVFLSYFAMWIWLFSALATMNNTYILKLIVWILWILVWLANLKDYFWYGKFFVMEVPLSWRPKMQDIIHRVSSPRGAFVIWLLVSLFLLPCSSGPYFTILWYLSAESKELHSWWYAYLLIYNLIFILPMFIIAILVSFGYSTVDKLAKIKHYNTKLIHLIVWLLMLGLWLYVLFSL